MSAILGLTLEKEGTCIRDVWMGLGDAILRDVEMIHCILVPEVTMRLLMHDLRCKFSETLSTYSAIDAESYGTHFHPNPEDENGSCLWMEKAKMETLRIRQQQVREME